MAAASRAGAGRGGPGRRRRGPLRRPLSDAHPVMANRASCSERRSRELPRSSPCARRAELVGVNPERAVALSGDRRPPARAARTRRVRRDGRSWGDPGCSAPWGGLSHGAPSFRPQDWPRRGGCGRAEAGRGERPRGDPDATGPRLRGGFAAALPAGRITSRRSWRGRRTRTGSDGSTVPRRSCATAPWRHWPRGDLPAAGRGAAPSRSRQS